MRTFQLREPLSPIGKSTHAQPWVCTSQDENGAITQLVVKLDVYPPGYDPLRNLPTFDEEMMAVEWFFHLLFRRCGGQSVLPVVANLETARAAYFEFKTGIRTQPGVKFASLFEPSLITAFEQSSITKMDATRLALFDYVVLNGDRLVANPNCGVVKGNLLAFDFGLSFMHVRSKPTAVPAAVYTLPNADNFFKRHIFYNKLKADGFDNAVARDTLDMLDGKTLAEIRETLPEQFRHYVDKYLPFLQYCRNFTDDILRQLDRSLVNP